MKVKLLRLRNSVEVMDEVSKKDIPATTSWKIARIFMKINEELEILEQERKKLILRYDPSGEVPEEKREEFYEEFLKLLDEEVDLGFEPIPVGELGKGLIKPAELMALSFMFKE
jgi:hypothetical protein